MEMTVKWYPDDGIVIWRYRDQREHWPKAEQKKGNGKGFLGRFRGIYGGISVFQGRIDNQPPDNWHKKVRG
jgi:hypothetical protein